MMENFSKDFYGDEFRWFLGIVEDIMDPPDRDWETYF